MFMTLDIRGVLLDGSPEGVQPEITTPTTTAYDGTDWVNRRPGCASNVEVRVLGTLLAVRHDKTAVDEWLLKAEEGEARMRELGELWTPMSDASAFNSQGDILPFLQGVLGNKIKSAGGDGTIETIVAVLDAVWGLRITAASIYRYFQELLKPRASRLKGPSRDGGKSNSARYVSALPAVMSLRGAGAVEVPRDADDRVIRWVEGMHTCNCKGQGSPSGKNDGGKHLFRDCTKKKKRAKSPAHATNVSTLVANFHGRKVCCPGAVVVKTDHDFLRRPKNNSPSTTTPRSSALLRSCSD